MKFVIYHSSTATELRNTLNQNLVSFRKGIKREEPSYPTLVVVSFDFIRFSDLMASKFTDVLQPMRVIRFLITDTSPKRNQI